MFNKLKKNNGGLKELIYDNIAIFIVIVLIVVVGFSMARKTVEMGTSVNAEQDKIIEALK